MPSRSSPRSRSHSKNWQDLSVRNRINALEARNNPYNASKGSAQLFRNNNANGTAKYLGQLGRPLTKYNSNYHSRTDWGNNHIKRANSYLNNVNHRSGLSRYALLRRAKQRMNNNLDHTREILYKEHKKSRGSKLGWNAVNRNNAFDPLFTMTKKQLKHIRNNPRAYLDNRNSYMSKMNNNMPNTPYIGRL